MGWREGQAAASGALSPTCPNKKARECGPFAVRILFARQKKGRGLPAHFLSLVPLYPTHHPDAALHAPDPLSAVLADCVRPEHGLNTSATSGAGKSMKTTPKPANRAKKKRLISLKTITYKSKTEGKTLFRQCFTPISDSNVSLSLQALSPLSLSAESGRETAWSARSAGYRKTSGAAPARRSHRGP